MNGVVDVVGHDVVYVAVNVVVYNDVAAVVDIVVDGIAYVGVWMMQM